MVQTIVEKHILVGLNYYDQIGNLKSRKQKHGKIVSADENKITFWDDGTNEEFSIPADYEGLEASKKTTEYYLKSNKKLISNVDLIIAFRIQE